MKPVVVCVGGNALNNWTALTLQRKKDDLTGTLELTLFAGDMPSAPIVRELKAGADVQVYVGGQLAFCGNVDGRTGEGKSSKKHDKIQHTGKAAPSGKKAGKSTSDSGSVNIGPDQYTLKISARGKTKRLIDSSHQHPTTNMMQPTTKEVVDKLVEPWKLQVDWKGKAIKLDKVRFRDGARVVDELHRIATEYCYFMYETRDGKLCVTDGVGGTSGDPLILGENILTFAAEQSEDQAKSEVKVKGQRSKKGIRGKKALEKTVKKVKNQGLTNSLNLLTIQHYGDATDEELERRARFEMNKRNCESKKITIEVFHVVSQQSGQPWDIGNIHYVEVPCEGIFDEFECTELTYHVNAEKELKTTLTLSPPPSGGEEGASGGFGLSALNTTMGMARRSQADIPIVAGSYPDAWSPVQMSNVPYVSVADEAAKAEPKQQDREQQVPLVLPHWFGEVS